MMKIKRSVILLLAMALLLVCSCGVINGNSFLPSASTVETSTPAPTGSAIISGTPTPSAGEDGYIQGAIIYNTGGTIQFLSNGMTLQEIGNCLYQTNIEVVKKFGENADESLWYDNELYYWYDRSDLGIKFISFSEDFFGNPNPTFSFIECDSSKVKIPGIKKTMDFEQIQNILGKTEVQEIKRGIPGSCVSYELRYIIDGVKVKFCSWKADGSGFNIKIVKTFDPKAEYIRITHETLNQYFTMNADQLSEIIGPPNEGNQYLSYYASFDVGDKMYGIMLGSNYEVDGVRIGMEIDQVKKILGKPDRVRGRNSEDDNPPWIEYEYKHFVINYMYFIGGSVIERSIDIKDP